MAFSFRFLFLNLFFFVLQPVVGRTLAELVQPDYVEFVEVHPKV